MWSNRTVAILAVTGIAAAGTVGVAVAAGTEEPRGPLAVIDSLVEDGTVSAEDAEAFDRVREQMQTQREERQDERQAQREADLAELADTIGISADELVERWRDGETLAEIAGDQADEVEALLTQRMTERIAEMEAAIPDRVDALMNREGGEGFGPHHGRGGHGMEGSGMGPDEAGFGFGPGPEAGQPEA